MITDMMKSLDTNTLVYASLTAKAGSYLILAFLLVWMLPAVVGLIERVCSIKTRDINQYIKLAGFSAGLIAIALIGLLSGPSTSVVRPERIKDIEDLFTALTSFIHWVSDHTFTFLIVTGAVVFTWSIVKIVEGLVAIKKLPSLPKKSRANIMLIILCINVGCMLGGMVTGRAMVDRVELHKNYKSMLIMGAVLPSFDNTPYTECHSLLGIPTCNNIESYLPVLEKRGLTINGLTTMTDLMLSIEDYLAVKGDSLKIIL